MRQLQIDWEEVFRGSSTPSALHGAAMKVEPAAAAKRPRAGGEGVARASSGDEQPRGSQALHPTLEALRSELERAVTLAAAEAVADGGQDAHSAAKNVHNLNQEDGHGEHVACKPSPVLVRRKKNHEQADGDCKCKRVARPSKKNDDQEPAAPEEIFEVLREIPSLERADLLRAYSRLIRDDRLFRSLVALPKDMRKDWLLMEIENE